MKTKKIICGLMIASMLLGAAGCSASGNSAASPTTAADEGSAPASVKDDSAKSDTVKNAEEIASGEIAADGDTKTPAEAAPKTTDDKKSTADVKDGSAKSDTVKNAAEFAYGETTTDGDTKTPAEAAPRTADDKRSLTADYDSFSGDVPEKTPPGMTEDIKPDVVAEYTPQISEPVTPPAYGQLTAGEWNDNANWGFFSNLVNGGKIYFPSFGLDPVNRTKITVKDNSGKAVVNASVSLKKDDGTVIWTAVSNKNGEAFLFEKESGGTVIEVTSGGKTQTYKKLTTKPASQQGQQQKSSSTEMNVTFDGEGSLYKTTDIMFILDTTGSMDDEMLFLQSEFTAITEELGTKNTRYSVNFYRDEGDDYVTRCYDFTDDISQLQQTLNSECADGGGDTPEAVAEILDETIHSSSWNEESVKLVFMIFDAPPHDGKEQVIYNTIKDAAAKGIRIIPVISSNSERDTELFGRSLAIMTGGTYVFLTDDSGIGGSHLEPIIGDYKVEKLYDIIIRVVNDYRQDG